LNFSCNYLSFHVTYMVSFIPIQLLTTEIDLIEGSIKNWQSRDTCNTWYRTHVIVKCKLFLTPTVFLIKSIPVNVLSVIKERQHLHKIQTINCHLRNWYSQRSTI
jgi:hypothetical protein